MKLSTIQTIATLTAINISLTSAVEVTVTDVQSTTLKTTQVVTMCPSATTHCPVVVPTPSPQGSNSSVPTIPEVSTGAANGIDLGIKGTSLFALVGCAVLLGL